MSWRLLEGFSRCLECFWQPFGGVLEAFEGFLDAPESILEASGGCLFDYRKTLFTRLFSLIFQVTGACGTLLWRLNSIQHRVLELIMGTK